MKKRFIVITALCTLLLSLLSACELKNAGPLKAITRPYIAQYECIDATLGEENILDKFEFITVTLQNKDTMELSYKFKDGETKKVKSKYDFDYKTHTLTAEIGLFGYTFKQATVIEKGKFTVSKSFGGKQLIMKFKAL